DFRADGRVALVRQAVGSTVEREFVEFLPAGIGSEDGIVSDPHPPQLSRRRRTRAVEDVASSAPARLMEPGVGPDLEPAEDLITAARWADRGGFAVAKDEATGVLSPAVVFLVGQAAQLLVPDLVSGAVGHRHVRLLAPRPELRFEDLALVRLRQLEEELLLLGEDDRRDELRQPLTLLFRECLDLLVPGELRDRLRGRGGRRDRGRRSFSTRGRGRSG